MLRFVFAGLIFIAGFCAGYIYPRPAQAASDGGADTHTNLPVTPGDPQSYVGTVGQCPFYERVDGPKGCTPPENVVCNADWSKCATKDDTEPISEPNAPPRASQGANTAECENYHT